MWWFRSSCLNVSLRNIYIKLGTAKNRMSMNIEKRRNPKIEI